MDEKPSISETSNSLLRVLPAAPRYLRRNAERAMGGHAVRGLVELISNARDSGYRLLHSGVIDPPSLAIHPIEVEYRSSGGEKQLLVRDHFEGMSRQIMESRLLQ